MDYEEKIKIWAPVWKKLYDIKKLPKSMSRKIPLEIRRDLYIKFVVAGQRKYHKALFDYVEKHKIS